MKNTPLVFTVALTALLCPVVSAQGPATATPPAAPAAAMAPVTQTPAALAVGVARPGAYAVTAPHRITLQDAKRKKEVPLSVTTPAAGAAGPFPVIIFSHGAGGSGMDGFGIASYWASHGYVVLCPTHADSIALARERGGGKREGLRGVLARTTKDPMSGADRARDVSFVLDSLEEIGRKVPGLAPRMDRKHIGVGGHSLGAYTAQLIGGATVVLPGGDKAESFRDPRAQAILQLSGQGMGQQGLTKESWKSMNVPMMTVTGTRDQGARGQGPEWKKEPFDLSPADGSKYHLLLTGAHHGSFTGRGAGIEPLSEGGAAPRPARFGGGGFGFGVDQKAIFGYVEAATLAFWDAYLKGDTKAKEYLGGDVLTKDGKSGTAVLYRK